MTLNRRSFLKSAGVAGVAAVAGGTSGVAVGGRRQVAGGRLRTVETDVLAIGYEESGSSSGFPIILLHGFPYDIRHWDGVVPPLAEAGYRVLVPYVRGYGPTRFLDAEGPRMAEQAAIAQDVVDFADALELETFALSGFDWRRAVRISGTTAEWPRR